MNDYQPDQFHGAYATPTLVGREELCHTIQEQIVDSSSIPRVIALTGDGGIGKTRLLSALMGWATGQPGLRAANRLIDLYHAPVHNTYGLVDELFFALTPPSDGFQEYEKHRRILERMRLSGETAGIIEQRSEAIDAFGKSIAAISQEHRVVLALDTAERVLYSADTADTAEMYTAESWAWLCAQLPTWKNVVVLVAGRRRSKDLFDALQQDSRLAVSRIEVDPFTEAESLAYFDAATAMTEKLGDVDTGRRIRNLTPAIRRRAHYFAEGRPILLALLLDYVSVAGPGQLPRLLQEEISAPITQGEKLEVHRRLEDELLSRLKTSEDVGDTLIALGRVPKGADAHLLAELLGVSVETAAGYLRRVGALSFVKVRPSDERVFLHDEMYAILNRQLFGKPDDAPAAETAAGAILSYYLAEQKKNAAQISKLFAPVENESKDRLEMDELADAFDSRRTLLTESLFYELRQDQTAGIQRYYRYKREAALSGDDVLAVQLQNEIYTYLEELHERTSPDLDELRHVGLLQGLLALHPVEQARASKDFSGMPGSVQRIRKQSAQALRAGAPFADATLDVWEASALSYRVAEGDLKLALDKLNGVITKMKPYLHTADTPATLEAWLAEATLGFAYRVMGYVQWLRGFMEAAIDSYRQASIHWRQAELRIEMATTLNDMGFAMAERGYWNDGRALVLDALELRRDLGPRSPVALSLNTLAIIETQIGKYPEAVALATAALSIFRALEDKRGIGLALCALSEALRRSSGRQLAMSEEEKVSSLREAREHAHDAILIFEKGEPSRLVTAWIEYGCACRDWARLRLKSPSGRDSVDRLVGEGRDALRNAARLAGSEMLHLRIDALVDLAWLEYIVHDEKMTDAAIEDVRKAIPPEYLVDKETGAPEIDPEQAKILLWPQIGKLFVLEGHRAFDGGDFFACGQNYCWGLHYSSLYAEDYHNLVRAKDDIYLRLKRLPKAQMKAVSAGVQDIEKEYHLGQGDGKGEVGSAMTRFLKHRALWYEP